MIKAHFSLRIDDMNVAHTRVSIFQGLIHNSNDVPLYRLTRGKSGELVIDTLALNDLVDCLKPVRITLSHGLEFPKYLENDYEYFIEDWGSGYRRK